MSENISGDTSEHRVNEEGEVNVEINNRIQEVDDVGEDDADGFISDIFIGAKGTYNPRQLEKELGTDIDYRLDQEDQHDVINQLLENTVPDVKWRKGVLYMLKECKSEISTRKCLSFLHSNVCNGLKAAEKGIGEIVQIGNNPEPKCLTCPDWMMILEGLNFDLTSPGSVRHIEHVNVSIGNKTDSNALMGFCHLMKAMLYMTWTNLQLISRLENKEGQYLNDTLATVCSGSGLQEYHRRHVEELESKFPSLVKSLGFRRRDKECRLQWQRPDPDQEFQSLCLTFHGLFCATDKIESIL